ncbi:MAG TPA: AAA family ATPase [Solirubrobacterales bacterium]|nr:AAA family ATPase [Solirubrobacterales bacterium]
MIGRGEERAALAALVAPQGGGTLVLRGEPGIGKSTLVTWALERAREQGMATVRIAGVEGGVGMPDTGIGRLCLPFADLLDELPVTAAATLRAVLEGDAEPPRRLALGVALTALLGLAAERKPLLIAADDAQWLDTESLEPLLFAARRLGEEPLALLIATRTEAPPSLLGFGLPTIVVGDFDDGDAQALVQRLAGGVSAARSAAIVAAAGGNPLALEELVRSLSPEQLAGLRPLPEPLGVAGAAAIPFHDRLQALPAPSRRALAVAAAEGSGRADVVAAALDGLGLGGEDLQPAEAAGLIERNGAAIHFVHPLCRAAAHAGPEESAGRAIHRALADAHAAFGDPVTRAEHLGRACEGPDEDVAAAIERAAELARRRAAPSPAARLALRAAELTPADDERVRRTLVAAWLLADTAHSGLALPAIEAALPAATSAQRTELMRALALVHQRLGRFEPAYEVLQAEAERIAADSPAAAGRLVLAVTARNIVSGTYADELRDAERALELARAAGDADLVRDSSLIVAHAKAIRGDTPGARDLLCAHEDELESLSLGPIAELASYPADAALWSDRLDLAERVLRRPIELARAAGDVAALIYPLTVRARLRLRRAELRAAEADAREAVRLAIDGAQTGLLGLAFSVLAQVQAVTGPVEECRENAERSIELGDRIAPALTLYPRAALGRLELAIDRPEAALEPLLWCERFRVQTGMGNPEVAGAAADLVEALVACGRAREAEPVLERLAAAAATSAWARAVTPRCQGLLAAEAQAPTLLREAVAAAAGEFPFEAARARLLLARRLRSGGDRESAATALRGAVTALRRIGATLWAERAAAELPPGERAPAAADPLATLTALEEQIARFAAAGLSNPEIGERLFYSRKTIERRLSQVFAKLGVRSRTELARLLSHD